jgi:acyl dehydratase
MHQTNEGHKLLYLEDLQVGRRFWSGRYSIDEAQIKAFAREFDPQPFHLDETAAEHSFFGGIIASGWHTAAATMRLLVQSDLRFASGVIGLGGEITWPNPVRPGDTLQVESEIIEILPSRSKADRAVVLVRNVTVNQNGDQVQVFTAKLLVFKRAADRTASP